MTSWVAAAMAMFLPRAMFAPGSSISVMPSAVRSAASVPSVEPPSTTMTSSGCRVWAAREPRNGPMWSPASFTVAISETFTSPPRRARRPGG